MFRSLHLARRSALISLILALLLVAVPIALAATTSFSGTLAAGPTYNRQVGNCSGLSGVGTAFYYTTRPFTVGVSGAHTFAITSQAFDSYLFVYRGSFNPASPLTNCVAGDDDSGGSLRPRISTNLTAGNYVLVITSFSNGATGAFSGTMEGPGIGVALVDKFGGFTDGRINRFEPYAQAAIYTAAYGDGTGLHIYGLDDATGVGTLALEVTPAMIAAVPALPAANSLIAATPDGRIALYRLTTGEFQVNTGPNVEGYMDVVIFSELSPLSAYSTYRFR
jgi:hypothetical protein